MHDTRDAYSAAIPEPRAPRRRTSKEIVSEARPTFILPTLADPLVSASPFPALTQRASADRLPLLNPSARDALPSRAAPFPPDPPPVFSTPMEASTSKTQLKEDLWAALAGRPDICVECMMRDKDMEDIDVTGPGVWSRASDVDYYDALQAEEQDARSSDHDHSGSLRKSGSWNLAASVAHTSDESGYLGDSGSLEKRRRVKRPKLGKGNALTTPSLRLWTSMAGSSSSHRWRTLHLYLKEQAYLMEKESAAEKKRLSASRSPNRSSTSQTAPFHPRSRNASGRNASNNSTVLPSGIVVEHVDVSQDEREARRRVKHGTKDHVPPLPTHIYGLPGGNRSDWSLQLPRSNPRGGQERRFSNPGFRSSEQLTSHQPLHSPSTSRLSVAWSERRPKSTSFWSSASRRSRAGSTYGSVSSFMPSGSMIDMHLGMDIDHEKTAQSALTPTPSNGIDSSRASTKKKKRGIKRLFSKLFESTSAPSTPAEKAMQFPHDVNYSWQGGELDNSPLQPPNPSYFDDAPRTRHDRSNSSSSQSSMPHSPKEGMPLSGAYSPIPQQHKTDPSQLMSRDSSFHLQPVRVVTTHDPPLVASSPTSIQEEPLTLKREKSLPALPSTDNADDAPLPPIPYSPTSFQSQPAYRSPHSPQSDSDEMIGGGLSSRARPKSRFGLPGIAEAFRKPSRSPTPSAKSLAPAPETYQGVVRDNFTALRYPTREEEQRP